MVECIFNRIVDPYRICSGKSSLHLHLPIVDARLEIQKLPCQPWANRRKMLKLSL